MIGTKVYNWCMSRTNIDIDDEACERVMKRYNLKTKRDAVNFALRKAAPVPMSIDQALAMEGTGWDGDLEAIKAGSTPEWL